MKSEEKRKLVFKEKTCQECGDTFIPKSGVQKFCKKEIEKVCPYCKQKYIVECGSREYYLFTCGKEPCKQARIKETNLKKFGCTNPSQNEEIKEKKRKTTLKHYGVENPSQSKKVKKKKMETTLKNYGVENPSQSHVVLKRKQETTLKNYGVENPSQSHVVLKRKQETTLKNYGVKHTFQKHIEHYDDWLNLESFLIEHDQEFTCLKLCEYFNVIYNGLRKIIREKCLENYIKDFYSLSAPEQVFSQELDKLNIGYELHNRKVIAPQEVDFYLPDYKLAIEVSPSWTHQHIAEEQTLQNFMGITDPEYHYNKFKLCKEQGIELITVFEWTDQGKVINFIKSKTLATKTIYARKTTTKLVQGLTKDHKNFLERNHILGSINNSKTTEVVELYYHNKIIGLAVFEQKKNYTELRRLAFESGYRVQGGASKLIKTFTRNHTELKELVTFSDNDLGTGNVYKQLGFQILEENKGTLIWYNPQYDKKIPNLSLVKQGTDRLLKNFPDYEYVGQGDDLPSNQEIIQQYGFVPIYDCGYTKWALALK